MLDAYIWGALISIGLLIGFYISGLGIKSLLNLRNGNPFSAIAVGFFCFFAYMTIISLPFQIFNLYLKDFIYIYAVFAILYFLLFTVLIKTWFNTVIFSMKLLQYLCAFFVIMGFLFLVVNCIYSTSSNKFLSDEILSFRYLIHYKVQIKDINSGNQDFLSSFYLLFYSIDFAFGSDKENFEQFVKVFIFIFCSGLLSSILISFYSHFNNQNTQLGRWCLFFASLTVFSLFIVAIAFLNISIFKSDYYFILLISYASMLVIQNGTNHFSEDNQPILIGFILGSYMAFSFKNTYPVLFLLYALIFATQLSQPTGYFREISKMSWIVLVEFAIYNFTSKLWVQAIIFISLFVFLTLVGFKSRSKYYLETKIELYLKERNIVGLLLFPAGLLIFSVSYALSKDIPIISTNTNYLKIIFWWIDEINSNSYKTIIVFLCMMALLAFSLAWLFLRQKFKKQLTLLSLDIFLILYLTFYNPFFTRTLILMSPDINLTSGYSLIAVVMTTIILIPFDISNAINNKSKNKNKLIINYKPNRLLI